MAQPCLSALDPSIDNKKTWKNAYRFTGKPKDLFLDWCVEVEEALDGTDGFAYIYYTPTATGSAPSAAAGVSFYDSTTSTLKYYNGSGWISLAGITEGSAGTLDDSYNSGYAIDVDGTAVTMTVSDGDNNAALIVNANDATNNTNGIEVVVASSNTGAGLYVNGTTGTVDLLGDNFSMANTGALTLTNDDYIENLTTDDVFEFASNDKEDFRLILSGTNAIGFSSGSSAVTLDFTTLDAFTGVASITGDAGEDFALATTNTGTYNFTIAQSGTGDNELDLSSAGTASNAIDITASTGGITATAATSITGTSAAGAISLAATGGDATVDSVDKSVNITAGEAAANAIVIDAENAGGGIDIDAGTAGVDITVTAGDLTLQNTTAKDIIVDATAGRVLITGTESAADAILLTADGANGEISLQAAVGGVDIDGILGPVVATTTYNAGNAIHIEENGGTSGGINIYANQGNGVSAATEHDASIQLQSDAGGIGLYTTSNQGDDIRIEMNGGTDENLTIYSNQGTGADSITLLSDVGGIAATASAGAVVITAAGGSAGDLTLTAGDVMNITSVDIKFFNGAATEVWEIEGTANDHEATISFTDPTADYTWTFPDAAADTLAVMGTTLATNSPEVANSVTGGTAELIFEGANEDAHETHLTAIEATADVTLTLPDDSGGVGYIPTGSTTKDATDAALPLTAAVVIGTSDADSEWSLPDGNPGQVLTLIIGTDGGAAIVTPDSLTGSGWATMVFTNDGEGASFMYVDDTVGWTVLGTFGISTNPLITQ